MRARAESGTGLADLMVGLALGMLAVLVMLQVFSSFELRRRATLGTTGAQDNLIGAVAALQRDLRQAGYGLGPAAALGCTIKSQFKGSARADDILQPVHITDGASGAPDSLRIMASASADASVTPGLALLHAATDTSLTLDKLPGIAVGDLLLLHESGKPCTLLQASAVQAASRVVQHAAAGSQWNPAAPATLLPSGGYGAGAFVIDLGNWNDRRYAIDASRLLRLAQFRAADNSWQSGALAEGIVNLQAQYGFDARSGAQASPAVSWWSSTMIDADGNGTAGDNGDLKRLLAVRFAIVARSAVPEGSGSSGSACTLAVAPAWQAGDAKGALVDTAIDVSKNPDGSANPDWRCYRYRVLEAVVLLRNQLWRE